MLGWRQGAARVLGRCQGSGERPHQLLFIVSANASPPSSVMLFAPRCSHVRVSFFASPAAIDAPPGPPTPRSDTLIPVLTSSLAKALLDCSEESRRREAQRVGAESRRRESAKRFSEEV